MNRTKFILLVTGLMATVAVGFALAPSNIDLVNKFSWSENTGWLNWRDANGGGDGIMVGDTFLSGFIWSENSGWINAGNGGGPYANTDDTNFGVNIEPNEDLSGIAWSENIGWINFGWAANSGNANRARVDIIAGRFLGWAWSENTGWINLDDSANFVGFHPPTPPAVSPETLAGEAGFDKDRYVSIDATTNGTYEVATRVTRVGGTDKYVDCTSLTDLGIDGWYASLIDGPLPARGDATYYCELSSVTTGLHIRGCSVVPGNVYDIAMTIDGTMFSSALPISTTPPQYAAGRYYGDTVGSLIDDVWTAPDGFNSAKDIVAAVQRFGLEAGTVTAARIDIDGIVPNGIITAADILRAANGFAGEAFDFGVTDCLTGTCVPPVGSCE